MTPDQIDVAFVAQLLRVRRFISDQPQSRNAAAFLVNGDNRLDLTQITQIIDELPELRGSLDVAAEEDKRSRLDAPKQVSCFRIQLFAGHTSHDQLTQRIALHGAER